MAALTALICSALQDLYDLTDAWLWTGLSISSSFRYLRVKRRLELFQLYCRELWLRESLRNALAANNSNSSNNNALIGAASSASVWSSHNNNCVKSASGNRIRTITSTFDEMQRDFIDFAAVEASQEAISSSYAGTRLMRSNSWDKQYGHIDGLLNMDDVEVISGLDIDTSFYEYYDANPVYVDANLNPLTNGSSFTITGEIPLYCERFSVNFIIANETKDIALHINPRLPQNYIVRNTKVREVWGYEEVSSPLPFTLQRGTPFSMQVLVTSACFMISVNGNHFAEYNHRLPFNNIRILEVKGDVTDVMVKQNIVTEYPQRSSASLTKNVRIAVSSKETTPSNSPQTSPTSGRRSKDSKQSSTATDEVDGSRIPKAWRLIALNNNNNNKLSASDISAQELSLPYYGLLPKRSLREGRCLRVEGRVRLLPQSFYINLQQGQNIWPHPIIAFHFNPRFSKQGGAIDKAIVCRNAWHNGSWDTEERSELVTDFRPGKVFSLAIVCTSDSFEVLLNRKPITKFKYRIKPDIVDTVYIQGDIKLWDVSLESV